MPSLLMTAALLLLSSLSLLQVSADHPFRSLQKRGVCPVPNEAKGCAIWGIDTCCQKCCAKYADGKAPESWKNNCGCPSRSPSVVVVTQPQPVTVTPVAQPVTVAQPVYVAQPQPVYVVH